MKQSIVCNANLKGGLGIRSLSLLNMAFFASGVGITLLVVIHYRKKSLGESLGRKKGIGGQMW